MPGDYDGDGRNDVAVFRPSTATWHYRSTQTGLVGQVQWGLLNDVPVPGDFDGDGKTDIAVFRPTTAVWYLRYSGGGTAAYQWGLLNDIPVQKR